MHDLKHTLCQARAEDKLLLLCTRPTLDTGSKDEILSLVQQNVSWDYLVERLHKNKLLPIFYSRIREIALDIIPQKVREDLQKSFSAYAVRNLALTATLIKLLDQFRAANIVAVPFKGPLLAAVAYGDVALRVFSDLDIAINEQDLSNVSHLLQTQEFIPVGEVKDVAPSILTKGDREWSFVNKSTGICIDLHWRLNYLFDPLTFNLYDDFNQLDTVTVNGFKMPSFSPEKQFLYLNLHTVMHCWESLSLLVDMGFFLQQHKNIKWDVILSKATAIGVKKILCVNLMLLKTVWDIPIPNEMLAYSNQYALKMANKIIKNLFFKPNFTVNLWRRIFIFMPYRRDNIWQGWQDLLLFLIQPNMKDLDFLPLPRQMFFLYFFIRPIRIIWRRFRRKSNISVN